MLSVRIRACKYYERRLKWGADPRNLGAICNWDIVWKLEQLNSTSIGGMIACCQTYLSRMLLTILSVQEGKIEVIANEEGGRSSFQPRRSHTYPTDMFRQTVKYLQSCLTSMAKNITELKQKRSWFVTARIPSLTSETIWEKSRRCTANWARRQLIFIQSFKSIDPTPCHASAHPQEHASTIAFSLRDTENESSNTATVGEITTRHIRRLRTSASDYTGKTVTSAVVAVPTDSTEEQKDALSKAFGDAQIEVLQFIPEPIAAVLAYDARAEHDAKDKLTVVADLGGNRSDVAIVASRGGMYSVLATAHDYMLGGVQLDQILVDHFAKEFLKKHKTDPRSDPRSLAKLKLESEAVKKSLSQSASAAFSVESLADGNDFRATINRTRYELLAAKIITSFKRLIEDTIRKAGLELLDIDQVRTFNGSREVLRHLTDP